MELPSFLQIKDWSYGLLLNGISDSDTHIDLSSADGLTFPSDASFPLVIGEGAIKEMVICTNVASSGQILTISRGAYGSTAYSHNPGEKVRLNVVSEYFKEFQTFATNLTSQFNLMTLALRGMLGGKNCVIPFLKDELRVVAAATPDMTVEVLSGTIIRDTDIYDYPTTHVLSISAAPGGGLTRIDAIYLNYSSSSIAAVQSGVASLIPVPPPTTLYDAGDVILAYVTLRAGATSVKDVDDSINGYITNVMDM